MESNAREVEPLLLHMAEAATHLLKADRASIFLWDRTGRCLIGRPALGVKDNELRLPDDRGVVGRVVQSGQPSAVDCSRRTQMPSIARVDTQLHYQHSHALVRSTAKEHGITGKKSQLRGRFEVINKHLGTLPRSARCPRTELAAHAAVALENVQDRPAASERPTAQIAEPGSQPGVATDRPVPGDESLRSIIRRVAETDLAVLICGENGTGKEVVAQSIHYLSGRRGQPLVALNCAAIPDTLAESEIFGHEKGAFTDARESRPGKFELASGGTLSSTKSAT